MWKQEQPDFGGSQLHQCIGLVADVRMRLWWWSTFCVGSIGKNCWVDGVDKPINELGYRVLCCMSIIIL